MTIFVCKVGCLFFQAESDQSRQQIQQQRSKGFARPVLSSATWISSLVEGVDNRFRAAYFRGARPGWSELPKKLYEVSHQKFPQGYYSCRRSLCQKASSMQSASIAAAYDMDMANLAWWLLVGRQNESAGAVNLTSVNNFQAIEWWVPRTVSYPLIYDDFTNNITTTMKLH